MDTKFQPLIITLQNLVEMAKNASPYVTVAGFGLILFVGLLSAAVLVRSRGA